MKQLGELQWAAATRGRGGAGTFSSRCRHWNQNMFAAAARARCRWRRSPHRLPPGAGRACFARRSSGARRRLVLIRRCHLWWSPCRRRASTCTWCPKLSASFDHSKKLHHERETCEHKVYSVRVATGTTRMSNSGRTAYYIVFRESDVPNACKDLVAPRVVGITAGGKWGGVCAALRILIARTSKARIDPRTLQSKHIVFGFVKYDQRVQDRSFLVMTPRGQYPSRTPEFSSTSSPTAPGPPPASAEWVFSQRSAVRACGSPPR